MANISSLYDAYGFLLANALRQVNELLEKVLLDKGLTLKQYGTMMIVSNNDNITQKEVGEYQHIDRTSIGQIIDALSEKGIMKRIPHPTDRRAYRLRLTANGKQTLKLLREEHMRCEDECLSCLNENDRTQLIKSLQKIVKENEHG